MPDGREGIIGDLEEAKRRTRSRAAREWVDTAIHHLRQFAPPNDRDVVSGPAYLSLKAQVERLEGEAHTAWEVVDALTEERNQAEARLEAVRERIKNHRKEAVAHSQNAMVRLMDSLLDALDSQPPDERRD